MKKLLNVFAIVLIGLLVLVSCSPETSNVEDKLAVIFISASERNTRSLTKTNPVLDAEEFWWSYTAKKTDETQLITGQTGADGTTVTALSKKGLTGAVGGFSYGEWTFTLYGYADENRTKLAYQGSSPVVITGSTTTIAVTVQSQTAGNGSGYLQIPAKGTITLKRTDAAETAVTDYSKFVERINIEPVTEIAEQDVVTVYDQANDTDKYVRTFLLKSGSYSVTISYLQSATLSADKKTCTGGYVVAEETIVVTIADYLTTKIGGDISENTSQVTFIAQGEITKVVANAALKADAVKLDVEIPATPAVASIEDSDTAAEVKKTTVSVPKGLVSGNVSNAKLSVTSYTQEAVSETKPTIEIKDSGSTTSTTAVVVGGLDIDLYVNDSADKTTEFANNQVLTITTYVAPGLNAGNDYTYSEANPTCDITVKYNGEGKSNGVVKEYVSSTGKLVFTVNHLSSFYIASKPVAQIGNTLYATLKDAVNAAIADADTSSTITLLCDSCGGGLKSEDSGSREITSSKSITIDFGKHTYTVTGETVGSTGTETQAMHWGTKNVGYVTLKNGKFVVDASTAKMAMQNYIHFTAENMELDFSKIALQNYSENEFSGANAVYNGLEVPSWGNNYNGTIKLKECTITMNSQSNCGICEDGSGTIIENSKINGYVSLGDKDRTVTVDSLTTISKDVVSYLAPHKVEKTEKDSSTVYKGVAREAKIGDTYYDTLDDAVKSLKTSENKVATVNILVEEVTLGNLIDLLGDNTNKTASATNLDALSAYNITFVGTDSTNTKVKTRTDYKEGGTNPGYNDARGASLTFKNMTVWIGYWKDDNDTTQKWNIQGFRFANSLSFENCNIEGYGQHWGKTNTFTNCTFSTEKDWCIDVKAFDSYGTFSSETDIAVTFSGCTFSSGTGEFINIAPTRSGAKYTVTVDNCTFTNTWSKNSGKTNSGRAAVFIKTKLKDGVSVLNCDVTIKGENKYEGTLGENGNWDMPTTVDSKWENLFAVVDNVEGSYKWSSLGNITVKNEGTVIYQNGTSSGT